MAKLRMHTDTTLKMLEDITVSLGAEFRRFDRVVCSKIQTEELATEVEARVRRAQKKAEKDAKQAGKDTKTQAKAISEEEAVENGASKGSKAKKPVQKKVSPQATTANANKRKGTVQPKLVFTVSPIVWYLDFI